MVMPVWRPREDWFLEAVESALAQEGVSVELIVVDDGNETPVTTMLTTFTDARLRVHRVEHRGYGAAINAGLGLARGRYVRLVDADDVFPRGGTAALLLAADGRQDVIAHGSILVCDEALRPRWRMRSRDTGSVVEASLLARFNVRCGGLLWSREVLRQTGEFDVGMVQSADWDYIQRAAEVAVVRRTRSDVLHYRRHGDSMTADIDGGRAMAREVVRRYFERNPEQIGTVLERRARAMLDATTARVYATHGQRRRAMIYLLRGLTRDPLCVTHELDQAFSALIGHVRFGLAHRLST